jgi:hypothetical protein
VDEPIKFFVGLDVHKDSMSIAACEAGREPARFVGTVGPDMHAGKNPHLDYQQKALGQPARLGPRATCAFRARQLPRRIDARW